MVTNSPDQSYLQMAFNRCQLRKNFDSLADALNNPAYVFASTALPAIW